MKNRNILRRGAGELLLLCLLALCSCSNGGKGKTPSPVGRSNEVQFCADSAYLFVKEQVEMGARVPGSVAHGECLQYIQNKLRGYGAEVRIQEGEEKGYDGAMLPIKNLIASFNPQAPKRVLLCTHWDCRQWADQDADQSKWNTPVMGADDGASGVGVLMEVARQLSLHSVSMGVDMVFFDTEDQGTPSFLAEGRGSSGWCLGSHFWSVQAKREKYKAGYGILLDMVGGNSSCFFQEVSSQCFAKGIVNRVWRKAKELNYASIFVEEMGMEVIDDHIPVNRIANIPCIDIIGCDGKERGSFPSYWHTSSDDMKNISKETLKSVGDVLLCILCNK
ncbi:MAG TPA: glutamine cyclotransferase [Porphyromonadaceae bacterium]|nr:glutamine cyclotransferase [Porphyromonadaceae bacterium]